MRVTSQVNDHHTDHKRAAIQKISKKICNQMRQLPWDLSTFLITYHFCPYRIPFSLIIVGHKGSGRNEVSGGGKEPTMGGVRFLSSFLPSVVVVREPNPEP